MKKCILSFVLISALIAACTNPVENRNRDNEKYNFAASMLDAYFLFRDKMPANLYAFDSPEHLYATVDEPFTVYYAPELAVQFLGSLTTATSGAGMRYDSVPSGYVIKDVFPNAPAQDCGLQKGDTITRIDDITVAGVPMVQFDLMLSGVVGESVDVTVKRGPDTVTKKLTFASYAQPSVFYEYIDSATAYIQITSFFNETVVPGGTAAEFSEALDSTSNAENLILDLRNNGGGYITQCLDVVSFLVEPQTDVIHTLKRDVEGNYIVEDSITYRTESGGKASSRQIFVLMNSWTASASEILISCLKSNRDDVFAFGTRTYGKARGQVYGVGPDSCLAKVTCQIFWPISGEHYDLVGIQPDIAVESGNALAAACTHISEGKLAKQAISEKADAIDSYINSSFDRSKWKPLAVGECRVTEKK